MAFATDVEISKAVKKIVEAASTLKLAVAFWGKGATELLSLDKFAYSAQIVCDAYSGACNPDVLESLMEQHDVRTLNGMHAKVYWSPSAAVVGSANASVNGLRSEVNALRYEAAIEVAEPLILLEIEAWFDGVFANAEVLDERSLAVIRKRWEKTQASRLIGASAPDSLLDVLIETPDDLLNRRLFVMVTNDGQTSKEALAAYESLKGGLFRPEDIQVFEEEGTTPFYEHTEDGAWDVRPNDVFIDFCRGSRGGLSFQGIWQVRNNGWRHPAGEGSSIIIVDRIEKVDGKQLSIENAKKLGDVLKGMIRENRAAFDDVGYLCETLHELRGHFGKMPESSGVSSNRR